MDAGPWRLAGARALAWTLLLGGWITIAHVADRLAAGPLAAYALVAAWLFALGAAAALIGRLRLARPAARVLLLACALIAARSLFAVRHGGGMAALLPGLLAWSVLVALASAGVRALRLASTRPSGPPVVAAATGALIAWAAVGDPSDLAALAPRVAALLLAAAGALALLLPSAAAPVRHPACRAGLFDCSLPAWPAGIWRVPSRWPLGLASFVMLPMMCSLPQMLALCRSGSLNAPAVLGLHLGAMFVPALVWRAVAGARSPALPCAVLLAAGGAAAALSDGAAWWWLAMFHGAAWSLAWTAQLDQPALRASAHSSPLRAAAGHAFFALALGGAVASVGPSALLGLQCGLAAAGLMALVVLWVPARRGAAQAAALGPVARDAR
ncbi:MAG: hypothetical protein KF788_01285 [Piscinibacter sp.]|nr:hypothetical protein [Piscinibacter sp.]